MARAASHTQKIAIRGAYRKRTSESERVFGETNQALHSARIASSNSTAITTKARPATPIAHSSCAHGSAWPDEKSMAMRAVGLT